MLGSFRYRVFSVVAATAALLCAGAPAARATTDRQGSLRKETIAVGNVHRYYLLFVPPGPVTALVIASHGFAGNDADLVPFVRPEAVRNGLAVAFPQGVGSAGYRPSAGSFNAGQCCGPAMRADLDDVGFVVALIRALSSRFHTAKVVLAGYSNGAMLSWRVACEDASLVHAVVDTSGTEALDPAACHPSRPVTAIAIHGTADMTIPYRGGYNDESVVLADTKPFRAINGVVSEWAGHDGCGAGSVSRRPGYQLTSFAGCRGGSAVELYTVYGMGHDVASYPGPVDFGTLVAVAAAS